MNTLALGLLMIALAGIAGCVEMNNTESPAWNETVNISSGSEVYPAYLAVPEKDGKWPAVVLIHSFNGLEPGYRTMADDLASDGFVVLAPQWQTFNRTPSDDTVRQLVSDSAGYLRTRPEVNAEKMGLTGFCAGGRYTMLLLPQMNDIFVSGVAWYGFPYRGADNRSRPVDFIEQLSDPLLIIHGTHDRASPISDIYRYATALNDSGKYFEMKVYQGEPHGFMIADGLLSESFAAMDAYWQMTSFFKRTLKP